MAMDHGRDALPYLLGARLLVNSIELEQARLNLLEFYRLTEQENARVNLQPRWSPEDQYALHAAGWSGKVVAS